MPRAKAGRSRLATVAAASTTIFAGACFIHIDVTAIDFGAIECFDGGLGGSVVINRDKSKATGAVGAAVEGDENITDLTVFGKEVLKFPFGYLKRQIADE